MHHVDNDRAIAGPVVIGVIALFAIAWFGLAVFAPIDNKIQDSYVELSHFVNITPEHQANKATSDWVVHYAIWWIAIIVFIVALIKDWHRERSGMG